MSVSPLRVAFVVVTSLCFSSLVQSEEIGLPKIVPKDEGVIDLLEMGLEAWQAEDGLPIENWRSLNGVISNVRPGSHIVTKQKFRNFDLSLEFSLPRGGNSGVYLRGRYEVQLHDGRDNDLKKNTGAIWGQIPIESRMYKGANTWNQLSIRMKNNTVTVVLNRKPVIRSKNLKGPTRGAINQNESGPGPILLQSLRGVKFRKIYLKEL